MALSPQCLSAYARHVFVWVFFFGCLCGVWFFFLGGGGGVVCVCVCLLFVCLFVCLFCFVFSFFLLVAEYRTDLLG